MATTMDETERASLSMSMFATKEDYWEFRARMSEEQSALLFSEANSLLASLDPDTLNPEQFNAWCALSATTGYQLCTAEAE